MKRPNYIATCSAEDEIIHHYGEGDTPEEALANFVESGILEDWRDYEDLPPGDDSSVEVYSTIDPKDSGHDPDTIKENGYKWICDRLVMTQLVPWPTPAATEST